MAPDDLTAWLETQTRRALDFMFGAISASHITCRRPGFGQTITPVPGSVVASPVLAAWDPEPDYFFHWYRDSALVIDALRAQPDPRAATAFANFVRFSHDLGGLRGADLAADPDWRRAIAPEFEQYTRDNDDLRRATPRGETRVNPDGSLDISRWNRPQVDGVAARILTVLRGLKAHGVNLPEAAALLRADLAFVQAHALQPGYDIWEEENGAHYYPLLVEATALEAGSDWLLAIGDPVAAAGVRATAQTLLAALDPFMDTGAGYLVSRHDTPGASDGKALDISVILAVIHADRPEGPHSLTDNRALATLDALDALFSEIFPINQARPAGHGPALGRYRTDVFFDGGAWYVATFAAAELCYARGAERPAERAALLARGDAYLRTARAFTPADGSLSEQFDRADGSPRSARHLAWSYAALLTAAARRHSITAL